MRATVVRLVNTPRFVRHANNGGPLAKDSAAWRKWRGKPITILLPPVEPDGSWSCDTPLVWRLAPEQAQELGIPDNTYVCVHQVEID